jgi:hypothetical protein
VNPCARTPSLVTLFDRRAYGGAAHREERVRDLDRASSEAVSCAVIAHGAALPARCTGEVRRCRGVSRYGMRNTGGRAVSIVARVAGGRRAPSGELCATLPGGAGDSAAPL